MEPWTWWSGATCLGKGFGLGWSPRSLPIQVFVWFHETNLSMHTFLLEWIRRAQSCFQLCCCKSEVVPQPLLEPLQCPTCVALCPELGWNNLSMFPTKPEILFPQSLGHCVCITAAIPKCISACFPYKKKIKKESSLVFHFLVLEELWNNYKYIYPAPRLSPFWTWLALKYLEVLSAFKP